MSSWEPDYYEYVGSRRNIHHVSPVANSTGVGRGLEQRWSSDLRNHVTDNREIWHHGHWLCGSCNAHRPHCPSCLTETTHRRAVTWWSPDHPGMKVILILLLFCVTYLLFVTN
ncbi:unnamed protein product [Pleuronectes platessa]|uniref:Uncharacterized protein n=1 Tax=Pleuronectes platessa TaxID=8262 RepID=A0A9N7TUH6_PLEPL|nr:unnamed protein product [Pleuronectes platessa]